MKLHNPLSTERAEIELAELTNKQLITFAIAMVIVLWIGVVGAFLTFADEFLSWNGVIWFCLFVGTMELSMIARAGWREAFRLRAASNTTAPKMKEGAQ